LEIQRWVKIQDVILLHDRNPVSKMQLNRMDSTTG